jgi:hypothetical protein
MHAFPTALFLLLSWVLLLPRLHCTLLVWLLP